MASTWNLIDLILPIYQGGFGILNLIPGFPSFVPPSETTNPQDPPPDAVDPNRWVKLGFLGGTGIIAAAAVAAPAIYAYTRKKKVRSKVHEDPTYLALESASNRATTLLAAALPAFAIPIAYIGVQELEQRGVISTDLGNAVQGLMTAGVVAPAVGNILGSVFSAVGMKR